MRRPTFFLSSTIYDFRDLRSSLKYFLEQRGCSVLASDFNDFRKPLDTHSYEACLRSIEQCDYFVLLIGSRVGGWYDAAANVSITQQEYRHAYDLHRAGKLKIVAMVRREVWDFRESHRELEAHLRSLALDAELARTVARHPTKFAEDAEFVIRFIEEVGRNAETRQALKADGTMPTGNWVHVFDSFRDVADLMGTLLMDGLPVEEAAFRRALRHEMVQLLRQCLLKVRGDGPFGPRFYVEKFREAFPLTLEMRAEGQASVPTKAWDSFSTVMMALIAREFRTFILPQALASPTFLEFDASGGTVRESPVFDALHHLEREIAMARAALATDVLAVIYAHTPKARGGYNPPEIEIEFDDIARLVGLAFRWVNIVELATAIIAHLDGAPFTMPSLMPFSPIVGMDARLERERVTDDEAIRFVRAWHAMATSTAE